MGSISLERSSISVCLAAYNGSRYIAEQLESILRQLGEDDEVIVVDDGSADATADVVSRMNDARVVLVRADQNNGYVSTFERAISLASRDVIFLSDQDDIWVPGRVELMLGALTDVDLVVTNFSYFGGSIPRIQRSRLKSSDSSHRRRNTFWIWVGTRPYYGCCMAFRASMKDLLLPFPDYLTETHDQWIGFVGNALASVSHLEFDSVARRIHADNATAKRSRPFARILRARIMTARAAVEASRRVRKQRYR